MGPEIGILERGPWTPSRAKTEPWKALRGRGLERVACSGAGWQRGCTGSAELEV